MKHKLMIISALIVLLVGISFSYNLGFKQGEKSFKENGLIIQEGNITYYRHFENYYGIDYRKEIDKIVFEIKNPCLSLQKIIGQSMLPYYDNETIIIIDTCFPKENLQIGDIILFDYDWNMTTKLHHRIVDINYEKELIKTKGDNLTEEDNFISFNQVFGKEIGVLNIFDDKKIVKEIYGKNNNSLICVCSSKGILKVCYTDEKVLMEDNFVKINNLTKENCEAIKNLK